MMYRQFKVPGVTVSDVKRYTKFSGVVKACKACGIELYQLTATTYNPLSNQQLKTLLRYIRGKQGEAFQRRVSHNVTE